MPLSIFDHYPGCLHSISSECKVKCCEKCSVGRHVVIISSCQTISEIIQFGIGTLIICNGEEVSCSNCNGGRAYILRNPVPRQDIGQCYMTQPEKVSRLDRKSTRLNSSHVASSYA